jgi:hypothetical protein
MPTCDSPQKRLIIVGYFVMGKKRHRLQNRLEFLQRMPNMNAKMQLSQ